jgi:hypothetical protein
MSLNMVIELDCGVSVYLGPMLILDAYEYLLEVRRTGESTRV